MTIQQQQPDHQQPDTPPAQALQWLVAAQSDSFSPAQQQALQQWLAQSPAHQQAFVQARQLWQDVGLTDTLIFSAQMQTAPARRSCWQSLRHGWQQLTEPLRPWHYAVTACFAFLLAGLLLVGQQPQSEPDSQLYQSSYQGNRQISLPDGSVLSLSGHTAVLVRFSDGQRDLQLQYGAAHFQVAKDSARPFVVTADQLQVRAVGTAFSVRRDSDIQVAVDEGVVAVSNNDLSPVSTQRLQQGQQIQYSARHGYSDIRAYHAASALSWRSGRLQYQQTPLAEVLAEVNRYRQTPIKLADASLAALPITATLTIDQSELLLDGLRVTHQLKIRQEQTALWLSR